MAKLLGPGDKFRPPRRGDHREMYVGSVSCSSVLITHPVAVTLRAVKGEERWALKLSIAEAHRLGRELLEQ